MSCGAVLLLNGDLRGQEKATVSVPRLVSRSVMNFSELAAQEARRPVLPRPWRATRQIEEAPPQQVPPSAVRPLAQAPTLGTSPGASAPRPLVVSPSPTMNFQGMSDDGTTIPPDTDGAVGPNHIVVALNEGVLIQRRDGTNISRVLPETFWGVPSGADVFDPRVFYDPYGNRWLTSAACCSDTPDSKVYVAVSATSDPTGMWYRFFYAADSNHTNSVWADFPSLGFNSTWVSVTFNQIPIGSNTSSGATVFYFSKADLYSNAPTIYAKTATATGGTLVPAVTYDDSLTTLYYVNNWNGNSGGRGYIAVSALTGTPGSESIVFATTPLVSVPFPWDFHSVDAPQQGTTLKVDNGDTRMLSVVYRNGSIWAAQNVFLPVVNPSAPTHTAAQWWQFLPNGTVQQFGRVEDTTAAFFYAYPSLAVNKQNDVLLGFTCFAATIYPSACYSFHAAGDAAGSMRDPVNYHNGDSFYYIIDPNNLNRWGDYSSTVVDPLNDTDFWTLQEYAAAPTFPKHPPQSPNGDAWGTWWANLMVTSTKKRLVQVTSD